MPPYTPDRARPGSFLIAQAAAVLFTAGLTVFLSPARLVWLPVLAMFFATYIWSKLQRTPCSRQEARKLSLGSGAMFGLLSGLAFAAFALTSPEQFDAPAHMIPVLGLFVGAGGGLGATIVSLCGIDTAGIDSSQEND